MEEYRLELRNVSKSFGEVLALENINFRLGRNEIVGLLGDNGAGKSTLIKILTGYHQPTSGEILFNGVKEDNLTVTRARELGVETVYQERALAELQTLWRNIFMGRELSNSWGFLDIQRMRDETHRLMTESMGFTSHAVSHVVDMNNVVINKNCGFACPLDVIYEFDQFGCLLEREAHGRFVKNDNFGIEEKGANDSDALFFTARILADA